MIEKGADVNAKDYPGLTALHWTKSVEVAKTLVEHGADIEAVTNDGDTPLINHTKCGRVDIVQYLLSVGANKKAKNTNGKTAYDFACHGLHADQRNKAELQKILKF